MKKIAQYIPFQFSIFLVIGVIIGFYNTISLTYLFISTSISITLLVIVSLTSKKLWRLNWVFQLFSYLTILQLGAISISLHEIPHQKTNFSHFLKDEHTVVFQIEKELKPTAYHHKYYINILQIDSINCTGKAILNQEKDSLKTLDLGDLYLTKTNFKAINSPLNPHTFNYKDYLKKQGIYHQISLPYDDLIKLPISKNSLKIYAAKLREKVQKSLEKYPFETDELGIINAIILGQRQNISQELLESYAGAGAIHILAVSGLHVGILFLILSLLLKPLEPIPYGSHLKMVLIIIILWGFALLTGLSGSVVRAVTMFTFISIGLAINNHKSAVLHALFTSFFILVLIYPLYIFDVGFQMSYAAVLGIVLGYPKMTKLLPNIKYYFPRKIWQLFCVSVTATIGTLPISLYYFHQFPALFFLSNIVIVPFIGIIMGIGILVSILSLLHILPDFLVYSYSFILSAMNTFIDWVAHRESFLIKDISFSILLLIGSYLVIAIGYRWFSTKTTHRFQTFLIAIIGFQALLFFEKYQTAQQQEMVVFHKTKETIIGFKESKNSRILHSFDTINIHKLQFLINYKVETNSNEIQLEKPIPNILFYRNKKILIIDSLGVYKSISFQPDIVLLRQSPKINLERLIHKWQPEIIIADGSNYKSYVSFWQKTCQDKHINFHYTGENGAFILKR